MKGLAHNIGKRRRLTIDEENYYLVVTDGADGWQIDITCPRENAPENMKLRGILEKICAAVNELSAEVAAMQTEKAA